MKLHNFIVINLNYSDNSCSLSKYLFFLNPKQILLLNDSEMVLNFQFKDFSDSHKLHMTLHCTNAGHFFAATVVISDSIFIRVK